MTKKTKAPPRPKVRSVSAWIVTAGRADRECQVLDISPVGAKVVVEASASVPERFELAFFQSVDSSQQPFDEFPGSRIRRLRPRHRRQCQ